jgi:hypothetical protein
MKKIALLIFFALVMQEGKTQAVWDSIGAGISAPSGVRGIWKVGGKLLASSSSSDANLYEYTQQNGWTQIITSTQPGQIWDVAYDSLNYQLILLGKYADLTGPVNSGNYNGICRLDLFTSIVSNLGTGVNYPFEYMYKGKIINGVLIAAGRFQIINGNDTIDNFMNINMQTENYSKICSGKSGDLVRDFTLYQGDIILTGSFLRNTVEYPLAKITPNGLDFSVNGPYRGFGHSIVQFNDDLVFAGDIDDTLQNLRVIGSYDGISFRNIVKTNDLVRKLTVFKDMLYIGGSFNSITDSMGITLPVNSLIKYDGLSLSEVLGGCTGLNSSVLGLYPSGDSLYVAGNFTNAGTIPSVNVAVLIYPLGSGIGEYSISESFTIFPNPTDGNFSIDIGEKFESEVLVQILDISGRKLKEFVSDLSAQVNLDLPNGVYFIKINESTKKLVVRK